MRLLLDASTDLNIFLEYREETPLNTIIHGYYEGAVEILLENGSNPNLQVRKSYRYCTVLPLLATSNQPNAIKIVKLLLRYSATIKYRIKERFGPFSYRSWYKISNDSTANNYALSDNTFALDNEREISTMSIASQSDDSPNKG